jgi:hypothetical protein
MNKEVKEGEKHIENSDDHSLSLSDLRKRKKQVETSRLKSLEKNMKAQKAKKKHQHRMRSTPGEVIGRDTAPASPHKEGKRWITNNRKKTKNNNKVFNKTSLKRS